MGYEPYIGEVMLFAGNFAPKGWALCNGQLYSIAQNTALFSLLGTTYGGDGVVTFALPNLQGRFPVHAGQGPGLSYIDQGQVGGAESVTLTTANLPAHSHLIGATTAASTTDDPTNAILASSSSYASGPANVSLAASVVSATGSNEPVEIRSPYLAMNWCIAIYGVFPSRS